MTLLAWEMNAIIRCLGHSLVLPFLGTGLRIDLFQSCGHCRVFQICWHECKTLMASSFRDLNSSAGISLHPLALLTAVLLKAHLTSQSFSAGHTKRHTMAALGPALVAEAWSAWCWEGRPTGTYSEQSSSETGAGKGQEPWVPRGPTETAHPGPAPRSSHPSWSGLLEPENLDKPPSESPCPHL